MKRLLILTLFGIILVLSIRAADKLITDLPLVGSIGTGDKVVTLSGGTTVLAPMSFAFKIVAGGVITLSGGSNVVTTTSAQTTNLILLSYRSLDGTLDTLGFGNITNGASFTILSGSQSDTNQVDWFIVKP